MPYADYQYYSDSYHGSTVDEADFPHLSVVASMYIDSVTMGRAKSAADDTLEAVKMAMCVLAEIFLDEENVNAATFSEDALLSSLSGESVGGWSKSFKIRAASAADTQTLDARKRNAIMFWLGNTGLLTAKGYYMKRR